MKYLTNRERERDSSHEKEASFKLVKRGTGPRRTEEKERKEERREIGRERTRKREKERQREGKRD